MIYSALMIGLASLFARRRQQCLFLALALTATLASCASQVPDDLSVASLTKSRDAVIVMAAVLDGATERSCSKVGFMPADSETWRPYDLTINLATGTIAVAGEEVIGSRKIAPGQYRIAAVVCSDPKLIEIIGGIATFSVSAGEVVNLGKLVVIPTLRPSSSFAGLQERGYAAHITNLRTDPRKRLNKDLSAHLIDRPMVLSQPPLPQAELQRLCKERRAAPVLTLGSTSPPLVCALAGL